MAASTHSDDTVPSSLPPLRGRDIVCAGTADWRAELWTNQQHLISRMAVHNRTLFIESLGLRRPRLARKDLRRMSRRLTEAFAPPAELDGVHVISPLVVPFHGSRLAWRANTRLLPAQVSRAIDRLGMHEPLLWSYAPQADMLVERLRPSLVVYHCVDDLAAQKGVDPESFRAAENRFAAGADLILASSRALQRRLSSLGPKVVYAPNVADVDLFRTTLKPGPVDPAMAALPGPRILFHGAIVGTKIDFEFVRALARSRPGWSIVLVGPIGVGDPSTDVAPLRSEPNIHLLGPRPHADLPAVLRGADAGLIPYHRSDLTESIFPMKVYEYVAAGLPLVTTPLPSIRDVPGITQVADVVEAAEALDDLLSGWSEERAREQSALASGHSWDDRLREIAAVLEST